jgi:DNA helicase-2/ATP-dependent DNA helicase PcrA
VNYLTLAVAGARKTQSIVEACASEEPKRRLVISYTQSAQNDIESRLRRGCKPTQLPTVLGWYAFLLQHWVRPFLPNLFPGRRLGGFNFEGGPRKGAKGFVLAKGADRYLDSSSRAYGQFLSKLSVDVAKASDEAVVDRLEKIYDEIYIDEVQDLTGYDLDIIENLLRSGISVTMVGDLRQSLFSTNFHDPRHPKYRGLGMLDWFTDMKTKGLLDISYSNKTWRSNQAVASFSDSIFDPRHKMPPTMSLQSRVSAHDGVYVVSPTDAAAYRDVYGPVLLRPSKATPTPQNVDVTNFGLAKGATFERVLIYPTKPILDFLDGKSFLAERSAFGLYVATTRAVHSVAFVHPSPSNATVPQWVPA